MTNLLFTPTVVFIHKLDHDTELGSGITQSCAQPMPPDKYRNHHTFSVARKNCLSANIGKAQKPAQHVTH